MADKEFYVYAWFDSRIDVPVYIGKGSQAVGSNKFHRAHEPRDNPFLNAIQRKINVEGFKIEIEIHKIFPIEHLAFDKEMELIRRFGRRDLGTGPLCSLTNGGEGVQDPSPEWLAKNKKIMQELAANPKERKHRSESAIHRWSDPEFKAHVGESISKAARMPQARKRRSDAAKARWADPKFRARVSKIISKSMKEKFANDESFKKQAKRHSKLMKEHFKSQSNRDATAKATSDGMKNIKPASKKRMIAATKRNVNIYNSFLATLPVGADRSSKEVKQLWKKFKAKKAIDATL